jgi:DNA-binding LytR/AlgR family response regulator
MMLTSDNYQFLAWDEDAFAIIKKDRDAKTSVDTFATLRRNNLDLLSGLSTDKLERLGVKANGEPVKLIDYLAYMSKHIKAHLEQAVAASK